MQSRRNPVLLLRELLSTASVALLAIACSGGDLPESVAFFSFIRILDPKNVTGLAEHRLLYSPCEWKGVKCDVDAKSIVEIRLVNVSLAGLLDTDSLCKLANLRVLNLAGNRIQGTIPESISKCTSLRYLDLSNNSLRGSVPIALGKLKNLRRLDISGNHFKNPVHHPLRFQENFHPEEVENAEAPITGSPPGPETHAEHHKSTYTKGLAIGLLSVLGIAILVLLVILFLNKRSVRRAEKVILKELVQSSSEIPPIKVIKEVKPQKMRSELVFFVEEDEQFNLEDLHEAAADLRTQGLCTSLYVVQLKNNAIFAVKRLKKLKVTFEVFGQTMRKIGNLKHHNILPLVAYNSTDDEKLLIYRYQRNGSVLSLLQNYIEGKRTFTWKHRLSIAVGIARGLDFIYRSFNDEEIIPHGNIKLSNILLNDDEEPLISEYGYSQFLDPSRACLFSSSGYAAPEKRLTEQADVFSFGMILLELLTGKIIETSGLDLAKWVKAMVREEWTGEVFDKEVAKAEMYAFPLLNIALNCIEHSPEERPSIAMMLEKIEEVVNAQDVGLSP